jgi:hypothetical protein
MTGRVDDYVRTVTVLARRAGLDADRIGAEVRHHLFDATEQARDVGVPNDEAERRAIEEFGPAESFVGSIVEGAEPMRKGISVAALAVALAATTTLLFLQITPSFAPSRAMLDVARVALALLGVSGIIAAWGSWPGVGSRVSSRGPLVPALALAALGVLTWAVFAAETNPGGLSTVAVPVASIGLVAAAIVLRAPWIAAVGFMVAGGVGLAFAGATWARWAPLSALASGRANLGAIFLAAGWLWLAGLGLARWSGLRARVAGGLFAIGRGVAPEAADPASS